MDHSLPPLEAFQAVMQAASTGSFSAAANALEVTHGAVSRRIAMVEAWAGVRLFERHGRGVRLTPAGLDAATRLENILRLLQDLRLAGQRDGGMPLIRAGVISSFARLWMIPNMTRLEGEPKDLQILLDIDSQLMPLASDRIAIRYGTGPWPGSRSIPLTPEVFRPYAAPSLARKLSHNPGPEGLLAYPLIHDQYDDGWPIWLDMPNPPLRGGDRYLPGYGLTISAAGEGLGIALVREPYGVDACINLGLVPVSGHTVANPKRFHILTHQGRQSPAAHRLASRIEELYSMPRSSTLAP